MVTVFDLRGTKKRLSDIAGTFDENSPSTWVLTQARAYRVSWCKRWQRPLLIREEWCSVPKGRGVRYA